MAQRLLGFFSGFPQKRFPAEIARRLREALARRDLLVFLSAWPEEHARNDADAEGMHGMFAECGMGFDAHCVIDTRMDARCAAEKVRSASCIFLMGGYPRLQSELLRDLALGDALRAADAVVLGVSAGAINMAKVSVDTKESLLPYAGLGLADVTVKPHFDPRDERVTETLLLLSAQFPICAMEDESAIFVENGRVTHAGTVHWVSKGVICPFRDDLVRP